MAEGAAPRGRLGGLCLAGAAGVRRRAWLEASARRNLSGRVKARYSAANSGGSTSTMMRFLSDDPRSRGRTAVAGARISSRRACDLLDPFGPARDAQREMGRLIGAGPPSGLLDEPAALRCCRMRSGARRIDLDPRAAPSSWTAKQLPGCGGTERRRRPISSASMLAMCCAVAGGESAGDGSLYRSRRLQAGKR